MKYVITVKTGALSPDEFEGNLGINIISRNFDTGFIKLDENIAVNSSKSKETFFRKNQKDVFQFEDQDIRTVNK